MEMSKRFAEEASKLKTGNPFKKVFGTSGTPDSMCWEDYVVDESVYYGPIINEQGYNKIIMYNKMVEDDPQAEILLNGQRLRSTWGGDGEGYFMSPMVYKTEWRGLEAQYLRSEVFGPHVAIVPFDTIDDAINIYNDTEYGLAVGILTNDFRKARIMRDECDAGMIYWNGGSIAAESHLAFGGVKKSGNGFPSAARTFRAVTHEISWTVNHADKLTFPQGMK